MIQVNVYLKINISNYVWLGLIVKLPRVNFKFVLKL